MGTSLRRPPPLRPRWSALRTRVADELRLAGWRRVAGAGVVVLVAVLVLWWLLRPAPRPVEANLPFAAPVTGSPSSAAPTSPASGTAASGLAVVVHVVGEVRRPGLVTLAPGARVADAVAAAGGATVDAQVHAVNLAAVVRDGQRVHIPHRDDATVAAQSVGDPGGVGDPTSGSLVPLNTAGIDQLLALPGVGPATAAAIVTHRDRHGPFTSVDALLDVPGIGTAKLEALRDLVTL